MTTTDFTLALTLDESPAKVFDAITNVRGWWSGTIDGHADQLGAEFSYRYKDLHLSKQKVTEFVRDKKIVWHVLDANLSFVENKAEWKGSDIVFEIFTQAGKTNVRFTHVGLNPRCDCYGDCSSGWSTLLNTSLRNLIASGQRQPDAFAG